MAACQGGLPPAPSLPSQVEGKAIVYAKRDVTMGDTRRWLRRASLADIPHPGEKVRRGHPICTVFASGNDAATCYKLLLRRASRVYQATQSGRQRAA